MYKIFFNKSKKKNTIHISICQHALYMNCKGFFLKSKHQTYLNNQTILCRTRRHNCILMPIIWFLTKKMNRFGYHFY